MSRPWMPLYVGDYLADTANLNLEETGAYLLLLMYYWRRGPLSPDPQELSAICKVSKTRFERSISPRVLAFFRLVDGRLHNARMDLELARTDDVSAKRSAAAAARKAHAVSGKKANAALSETASPDSAKTTSETRKIKELSISIDGANDHQTDSRNGGNHNHSHKEKKESKIQSPSDSAATSAATPVARPIRDALWADGWPIIQALTGKSERSSRALLGKLLASCHDDCALVYRVLREAESLRPVSPEAWLSAAVSRTQGRSARPLSAGQQTVVDQHRAARAAGVCPFTGKPRDYGPDPDNPESPFTIDATVEETDERNRDLFAASANVH